MKIHGHPQKSEYASEADWPSPVSAQAHIRLRHPMMPEFPFAHVHFDVRFPRYAEVSGPFTVPFTLKLFHAPGHVDAIYGLLIHHIVWDETGSEIMPDLRGDPMGLKQWTGRITVDPTIPMLDAAFGIDVERSAPKRGWFATQFVARLRLDDGRELKPGMFQPAYSMVDPTAPERPAGSYARVVSNQTESGGMSTGFGAQVSEFADFLPIAPIQTPWTVQGHFYNYSADPALPTGVFEQRLDPDLHNGIPGTILRHEAANGQLVPPMPIVFDPAVMGSGTHKVMFAWEQAFGDEEIWALLVIEVTVGPGVPAPVKVLVPSVVGQSKNAAASLLTAAGLMLGTISGAADPTAPVDAVIGQFPSAGALVVPGSTVNLTVSTGAVTTPTQVWVPAAVTFMQLHINGVPQDRWKICDPAEPMDGAHCPEIVTKP